MSKTIKSPGGITVRVIEAINGFKSKHGYWPSTIAADAELVATLATQCLTPLGFFLLQSKIDIVIGESCKLIANGNDRDVFDYGDEGWQGEHRHDARQWLGLDDD